MTLNHHVTVTLRWDLDQFDIIRSWFGAREDAATLQQVTDQLKAGADSLTASVAKTQPPTKKGDY